MRGEFEKAFLSFVARSAALVQEQTGRRVAGATLYNERVNAIFAYLQYKLGTPKKKTIAEDEVVEFLRFYNTEAFEGWDDSRILEFARGTSLRKGSAQGMKDRRDRQRKIDNYDPGKKVDPAGGAFVARVKGKTKGR